MKEIIVDANFGQIRAALLEDHELVEIYIEGQEGKSIVGNIYKGKVENVLPGMEAAFVNIGTEKNAFLYVKDAIPNSFNYEEEEFISNNDGKDYHICDLLKSGQDILVQVIKDPIDSKGARVTTHITLPGRYAVLMPKVDYIGISRRIEDEIERERLREIAALAKPDNMGMIVRTAGEDCGLTDLESDMEFLTKLWKNLLEKSSNASAPRLIHMDMDLFYRILRDMFTKDINHLIINNKEYYNKAVEIVSLISPNLMQRIEYFNKSYDIFECYHIEEKAEKLLCKKIWLKCGGYIVIDQTEALTVIDVNTGKYVGSKDLQDTVLKTNIEAAKEIARQLRLRDIGGIVIVDFIDMYDEEHQNIVIEVMKNAMKKDKSKSCVWGMTHLGLLELTRKKVLAPKENMMQSPCPCCLGTGRILSPQTIVKKIEKEIKKAFLDRSVKGVKIEVHPEIKKVLIEQYGNFLESTTEEEGKKINIIGDDSYHRDQFEIMPIKFHKFTKKRV